MRIKRFIWPEDRIEHIARHGVTPEEVENVCFGKSFVRRAKSQGENPVYYVLGQAESGRYLFCVVIRFPDGIGYPVTEKRNADSEIGKNDEEIQTAKNRFHPRFGRVLGYP